VLRFAHVTELSDPEAELWHAWKRASDSVMSRIGHDLAAATGLSGADYGVLSRLVDLGRGTLRQQDLANSMLWQKSRLSHHLSRMAERQLVRRTSAKANVVLVVITPSGRQALRAARPIHAGAIRAHLLSKIPRASRRQLLELLTRLSGD
jgi:DNA-binding MarR family transcriptional regulator